MVNAKDFGKMSLCSAIFNFQVSVQKQTATAIDFGTRDFGYLTRSHGVSQSIISTYLFERYCNGVCPYFFLNDRRNVM